MKLGFTYDLRTKHSPDPDSPPDYYGEYESEETVAGIISALTDLGHQVVDIGNIHDLTHFLAKGERVDLVFNMAEGRYGRAREAQVPNLLEAYQIPYTFSDSLTLAICLDKGLTKQILQNAGIPTAEYLVLEPDQPLDSPALQDLAYPLFAKPLYEGTSKGISAEAIIHTPQALIQRVRWLWQTYRQPALIETYLPGKEFTVGMLGEGKDARVLGMMQVHLKQDTSVYGFREKENYTELVDYTFDIPTALQAELSQIALASWRTLGCRDGGRVDLRLDEQGAPHVLELNTLPGMHHWDSDLPIIARHQGMDFTALMDEILIHAMKRMNKE